MSPEYDNQEELKNTPTLQNLKGSSPFKAPEGYFDEFPNELRDKIISSDSHKISLFKFTKPAYAIAAVLIICIAGGIYFRIQNNVAPKTVEISCTYDELKDSEYLSEIDEGLLADQLASTPELKTTNEKDIEEYLISNSDEYTLIN